MGGGRGKVGRKLKVKEMPRELRWEKTRWRGHKVLKKEKKEGQDR